MKLEEACSQYGLDYNNVIFDGQIQRFKPLNRNDKSGWYVAFNNYDEKNTSYKVLVVGDWSKNIKTVSHSHANISSTEMIKLQNKIKYQTSKAKKLKVQEQEEQSKVCTEIFSKAVDENNVPAYLYNKKIDSLYGAKVLDDCLLIPIYDNDEKIWSLQKIFDDGKKLFHPGGKIKGNYFVVGEIRDVIYLCEGFATGCSVHMATGEGVVCAFNVGNCDAVYQNLVKKYPSKEIIFCADNDRHSEKNAGIEMAESLFYKYKVEYRLPKFDENDTGTDFNDVHVLYGIEKVAAELSDITYKDGDDDKKIENLMYWKSVGFFFEVETKSGVKEIPCYKLMADYFKLVEHFKCDDSYRGFYDDDFYKLESKTRLMNKIFNLCRKKASPAQLEGFYKMISAACYFPKEKLVPKPGLINLRNGVLSVSDKRLYKHDPSYNFTYKLKHDYDVNATCPNFSRSLHNVCEGNSQLMDLMQEIFGYVIEGGEPIAQKAFVFIGSGANGKSTIIDALKNLVGKANISSVPMSMLHKPFSVVTMDGKLANLVDETPKSGINAESFKNIVTGGSVQAAFKGRDEFTIEPRVKLIFACNEPPNFGDSSHGLRRRLIVFPFNANFTGIEDYSVSEKIRGEMSGILNWALEGLDRLKKNHYKFTIGKAVNEAEEALTKDTDSVYSFMDEHAIFMDGPNGEDEFLRRDNAYSYYKKYCVNNGFFAVSSNTFSRRFYECVRKMYEKIGIFLSDSDRIKLINGKPIRGAKRVKITLGDFFDDFS